jgi:hypothetical protein
LIEKRDPFTIVRELVGIVAGHDVCPT